MNRSDVDRKKHSRKVGFSRKKNALVIFDDGKEFWTTQNQFWQWVRDKLIVKAGDNPLRGISIPTNQLEKIESKTNGVNVSNQNQLQQSLLEKELRKINWANVFINFVLA